MLGNSDASVRLRINYRKLAWQQGPKTYCQAMMISPLPPNGFKLANPPAVESDKSCRTYIAN